MKRLFLIILSLIMAVSLIGCGSEEAGYEDEEYEYEDEGYEDDEEYEEEGYEEEEEYEDEGEYEEDENEEQTGLTYTLPDGAAAYTIMVYINGSDLESESACASDDITEMMAASFPSDSINVIIQTGGTAQWQNEISSDYLSRYRIADGEMELLEELPLQSIGDSATLSDFINYCMDNYPAERFGLVMWNHGGGSVSGFGVDELFDYDGLTLPEIQDAFENSYLSSYPLELLGFDACLMASLETAYIAKDHANYLVASEELEPGYGWDYETWLTSLGNDPSLNGAGLGSEIVDSFVGFYNKNDMKDEATTLSVVDLAKVEDIVQALEDFVAVADISDSNYSSLAKPRSKTREFGMPTEYGGSTDMIDIVHMAQQFKNIFPNESEALIQAIETAVVHKDQSRVVDNAGGLSLYFPYSAKDETSDRVDTYQTIDFSPAYISYVKDFAEILTGETFADIDVSEMQPVQDDNSFDIIIPAEELENIETIYFTAWVHDQDNFYTQIYQGNYVEIDESGKILTEFDGIVTTINGYWACLYEVDSGEDYMRYAVPAKLNGQEVILVVLYEDAGSEGKVIGAMPVYNKYTGMAPKQLIEIKDGDEIKLTYYAERFADYDDEEAELGKGDTIWFDGESFVVDGPLVVEKFEVCEGIFLYGFTIIDLQGNEYYTDFIEVEYSE